MKTLLALLLISTVTLAQDINEEFEKFPMGDSKTLISNISLSPDQKTIAAGCIQGFPLHIYDWETRTVVKKIDVKGYYAGPKVAYSDNGKYLLLQQQFYNDFAPNKDKKVNFMVVDIAGGKMLHELKDLHDAAISPNSKFLITLKSDEVVFHDLQSLKKVKSFKVEDATNAIAISPDGKKIAISHKASKKDLESIPSIRNDRKAIKSALKFRELITVYATDDFKKLYTVPEIYDVVYKMQFTSSGNHLLCYSIPNTKLQTSTAGRQGYINKIDAATGEPSRVSFLSLSVMEPDIKLSEDEQQIGIISVGPKSTPSLNIYDFESGKMRQSLNLRTRMGATFKNGEFGGYWSFTFLPENRVLIASGNRLIIWKLKP